MATNPILPYLSPAPVGLPVVDLKTGLLVPNWNIWFQEMQRVIFGVWTDVPFDATNFTTDNAGITWNVVAANVNQLSYFQMGSFAVVAFSIIATTVSADVGQLRIRIPTLRQKADSTLKVFSTVCTIAVPPAATEDGGTSVQNLPAEQPVRVMIARRDGVNFPAAAASISVIGIVIFECVSVVVP